jgi:hypothetical protein
MADENGLILGHQYQRPNAPGRLLSAADAAFNWLVANLDRFEPFPGGTLDLLRSKALLEVTCISMYYKRLLTSPNPLVEKCIAYSTAVWRRPEFCDMTARQPGLFRLYATTYIALRACGELHDEFDEVVQRVIDQGYVCAMEDVPFRILELRYILDLGGFEHSLPGYRDLFGATLLAKMPPLACFADEDAYSVTHTIFYLTDFGSVAIETYLNRNECTKIRDVVEKLLGHYLRARNWDLVAELLMCCTCIRWLPAPVGDLAWDCLLAAQLPDGSVPGPFNGPPENVSDSEPLDLQFFKNYHTTLVTALTCFSLALLGCPAKEPMKHAHARNRLDGSSCAISSVGESCSWSRVKRRSALWLESLPLDDTPISLSCTSLLQMLVAWWICGRTDALDSPLPSRIAELLPVLGADAAFQFAQCDAALVLVSCGVLRAIGRAVPSLESFVKRVAVAVHGLGSSDVDSSTMFATTYLLNRLGLASLQRPPVPVRLCAIPLREAWFASDEVVRMLCLEIGAATSFGAELLPGDQEFSRQLSGLLTTWSLQYARNYNLEMYCLVRRCLHYAHLDVRDDRDESMTFLSAQQRQDGRFGFVGPEELQLRLGGSTGSAYELHLPLTLTVLWTFYETLTPNVTLFSSF